MAMLPLDFLGQPPLSNALMGPRNDFVSPRKPSRSKRSAIRFIKKVLGFASDATRNHYCEHFLTSPCPPRLGESMGPVNERIRAELCEDGGFEDILFDDDEILDPDATAESESDWHFVSRVTTRSDYTGVSNGDKQPLAARANIASFPTSSQEAGIHSKEDALPLCDLRSRRPSDNSDHQSPERALSRSSDFFTESETVVSLDEHSLESTVLLSSLDAGVTRKSDEGLDLTAALTRATGAGIFMPPPMNDTTDGCDDTDIEEDSWFFVPTREDS